MQAVRNVIFDLGGVVLDWNPGEVIARFEPAAERRAPLQRGLFGHGDWHEFDRGDISQEQLVERLALRTGRPPAEILRFIGLVRDSLLPKPETLELLRTLCARGTPLYCLSNMPVPIYEHLRGAHAFWDYFRGIVISGEARMIKPERALYEHLLQRFALRADQTVFVDDLAANVEAARAVGLHAILFSDAAECGRCLDRLLAP